MRRLAALLDTLAGKLGRLAAVLEAMAETGEAAERKHNRRWACAYCGAAVDRCTCDQRARWGKA